MARENRRKVKFMPRLMIKTVGSNDTDRKPFQTL